VISIRDAGSTYLLTFRNGKRLNPRTSMSSIWHVNFFCTVVAIWNYFRSNMYGSATSEPSSEQGRRKLTSHWSSRWINQFSCQFLMDCFVHVRCIPQQNSQWRFWASVCVNKSVCVNAFRMTELCGTQMSIREDTSKYPITGWPVRAARRTCRDI